VARLQLSNSDEFSGYVNASYTQFRPQLATLWFGLFARLNNGAIGSSGQSTKYVCSNYSVYFLGFENVFVGETNQTKVIGLSNWLRFYRLEQRGAINYHGWFERQLVGSFFKIYIHRPILDVFIEIVLDRVPFVLAVR